MDVVVLTFFARAVLLLTHEIFIVTVISVGYLCYSKSVFARLLFIVLFTISFNGLLKAYFQIPLAKHLGEGFAFPSGHMQFASVFYCWLLVELRYKILYYAVPVILTLIAWALVYCGYHNYNDVVFSVIFALLEIGVYRIMLSKVSDEEQPSIGFAFAILMSIMLLFVIKPHYSMWSSLGAIVGFSVGYKAYNKLLKHHAIDTYKIKALKIMITLVVIFTFLTCRFNYFLFSNELELILRYGLATILVSFFVEYIVFLLVKIGWLRKLLASNIQYYAEI